MVKAATPCSRWSETPVEWRVARKDEEFFDRMKRINRMEEDFCGKFVPQNRVGIIVR